jgi:aryl-alcohol dehydrogenase-like predicted oxidoreductase
VAWISAQAHMDRPDPGTRRVERIEANTGATAVPLSADEIADLDASPDAASTSTATDGADQ